MKSGFCISKVIIFSGFFLLLFFSPFCKKEDDQIPYVDVNFTIYLNDPEFSALTAVGNSLVVTGGYNGIVIYRLSVDEFMAYERTCTADPSKKCSMETDDSGVFIVCDCCGSKFLLLDGSPADDTKPAVLSLRQYNTNYYEGSNMLHVYN
ncbi:MAG: hypothetical protein KJ607_09970 [Bacteroidetes bacterium]|nr:hypothetical protein [Bacteroidota bacterium]